MTNSRTAVLCVLVFLAFTTAGATAQTGRQHTVDRILVDGNEVRSASGGTVIFGNGRVSHSLRVGEAIPDGTRIDVPAGMRIVLVSTGAKSKITIGPNSSFTVLLTDKGEMTNLDHGSAFFAIIHGALDFFQVKSAARFVASVKGTDFSIAGTTNRLTFICTRGEVQIAKTGYLRIGKKLFRASLIDVISAARRPQATYYPSSTMNLFRFSNYAEAAAFFRHQLEEAQRSGDENAVNAARLNLGLAQQAHGEYLEALHSYEQALDSYRQRGDLEGEAIASNAVGVMQLGGWDETVLPWSRTAEAQTLAHAGESFQRALTLFRRLGDIEGEANAFLNIGDYQTTRHLDASQAFDQAFALFEKVGDLDGEAKVLGSLGSGEERRGRFANALTLLRKALSIDSKLGDAYGESTDWEGIGFAQYSLRHYAEALRSYQQALELAHCLGDDSEGRLLSDVAAVKARMKGAVSPSPGPTPTRAPRS